MQDLQRRPGAGSGPSMGADANQLAPGRRTLVDALPLVPPPRAADDEVAGHAPDQPAQADPQAAPAGPQAAAPEAVAAEGSAPVSGPLSAGQTAAAIQFHTAQPWKYTKAVVSDIQSAVGVPATGLRNAATVQAIAARQANVNAERKPTPPLQVDGKAGPRTLPILKQVGLATDAAIDTYVEHIGGMKDELDKATPAKRAELLMKEINARLAAAGVPQITKPVVFDDHLNAFSADTWTMTMSEVALADPKNAATTMYHEARHAEQSFRIARMLAGKKRTAEQITAEASIDATIAVQAVAKPLAPGTTEAVEAEGWHEDEGGRPPRAETEAKSKVVFAEFLAAARVFNKEPTPANRTRAEAAYEAWKDVYYVHDYRDRPHEYDAFYVGEKVGDKLGVAREAFLPFDEVVKKIPPE